MAEPTAVKDRPHTQAQVRYVRMSASKARQVLELIRGKSVGAADDVLALSERDAARVIQKCLRSAVANAEHNDGLDPEELFVATCFADEGPTLRRFRPRARGRATRIRKRTCHITVIVARYSPDELTVRRESERTKGSGKGRSSDSASRRRRVAKSRGEEAPTEEAVEETVEEPTVDETDKAVEETDVAEAAEDTEPEAVGETAEDLVEGHTKDELLEIADEAGVDAAKSSTKAEIAGAIEVATASADELAEAHTKDELLELADQAGVEVAKSWTKPQIAEAIVASREDD
jgi:large subunit ribosomal protein L22